MMFQSERAKVAELLGAMATLIDDGLSVKDVLVRLPEALMSVGANEKTVRVLRSIQTKLSSGVCVADSFRAYLSQEQYLALATAERAGRVAAGLRDAALIHERRSRFIRTIVLASLYPIALVIGLIGMLVVFGYVVLPQYAEIVPVDEWSHSGQLLYFVAGNMVWAAPVLAGIAFGLVLYFRWAFANQIRWRILLPFKIYDAFLCGMFALSFACLIRSRCTVKESLEFIRDNSSPYMSHHAKEMLHRLVKRNMKPANAIDTGLFSEKSRITLQIYDGSKGFNDALEKVASNIVEETELKIGILMKVVSGAVLVFIGAAVGVLSMVLSSIEVSLSSI